MVSYFCSNPFGSNCIVCIYCLVVKIFRFSPYIGAVCWPMVFSTFSHYSLLHFGANMYVLHSFMNGQTYFKKPIVHIDFNICSCLATAHAMGKEHFLGFYLSAGVISSLASHVFKTALRSPGISLGAVESFYAYFCISSKLTRNISAFIVWSTYGRSRIFLFSTSQCLTPNSLHPWLHLHGRFSKFFLKHRFYYFTYKKYYLLQGLKALLCLDTVGLIMRWKLFDHAAHLGGALFGL